MTSPEGLLLESLDLGSARGRREAPLLVEIVRPLTEEDLPLLRNPPLVAAPTVTLERVTYVHHQLARWIALGKRDVEISALTGYSQSYISTKKNHDPAFRELVAYYAANQEEIFVDVAERMKAFGLTVLEDLQQSYETESDEWTKKQKFDLIEMLLIRPQVAQRSVPQGGAAIPVVHVGITFVKPKGDDHLMIEGESIDVATE